MTANTIVNGSITLFARWTQLHTVTFNANGGTPTPPPITVRHGEMLRSAISQFPPVSRTNFKFGGWVLQGLARTANSPITLDHRVNSNMTLTTQWDITVTFNPNGGQLVGPVLNTRNIPQGSSLDASILDATRPGFQFVGWFTTSAATGGTEITRTTLLSSNQTVFARWRVISRPVITNPSRDGLGVSAASDLRITWNALSGATYHISVRNIDTDRLVIQNTPVSRNEFTLTRAHLTPGHSFRIAVSATEPGGQPIWYERVFSVSNPSVNQMMNNLASDTTLAVESPARRTAMVTMGRELLNRGYEPTFVAGMLANIMREGSFGQFEFANSQVSANQDYLQHFVANHSYFSRFSGRQIHHIDVTLQELRDIVATATGAANRVNIFGLGIVQWTSRDRFFSLLDFYTQVSGGNGRITQDQVTRAEILQMAHELESGQGTGGILAYRSHLPTAWRARNADLTSEAAAGDAGYLITRAYTRPAGQATRAPQRRNDAIDILRIMRR